MHADPLPFLDMTAPGFSTRSKEVIQAREQNWCARTPFGLAVLRHRHAGLVLRDRRLRQGSYAWPETCGLTGTFADFWRRSLISQEGAQHKTLRRIAQTAMSKEFVDALRPAFESEAAALLTAHKSARIEFMSAFSEPFAGRAVALLLGLDADAAQTMARDASTLGLAMGLDAAAHQDEVNAACDRLSTLAHTLIDRARQGEDRTSYVARLLSAAADAGPDELDDQELVDLIVISIFGGVDTTRAQLGFAMALFAQHQDQWAYLRQNPESIPGAIEEIVRTRPTTTWSTREAVEDIEIDGVQVRAGQTVHILVHATGTDPLATAYQGFDVRARRRSHFGFGGGAHHCLGQYVARTDMACALRVLTERWHGFALAETPLYLPESGNTSPVRMPLRIEW